MSAREPAPATPGRIAVRYRLRAEPAGARALARRIALEQTVELPEALVTDPRVLEHVVGRVESVGPDPDAPGRAIAVVSYAADLAGGHLPGLLNLVFGNASLYPGVALAGLELPPEVLAGLAGPTHGVEGLRRRLGVHGRALLATALKPRGSAPERLAAIAHGFALGGGDIVKDDQNLVDDLDAFERRVELCARAVEEAGQRTGRACLYLPHVSATAADLPRYLDAVEAMGLPGVLVCPMLLGLDTVRAEIAGRGLLVMAHPSLTGSHFHRDDEGIAHEVLLGTLFRLAGADISIFPSFGGRFAFTREQCLRIADALRAPLGGLAPAWPCPAGGMALDRVAELCDAYGPDSVFLIGGALLGHDTDVAAATRAFAGAIRARQPERAEAPRAPERGPPKVHFHAFREGFEWAGRESRPYKDAADLAFRAVRRVELAGRHGERTAFDLRYFEVAPGGYTSHERHVHAHVIVGARGTGVLVAGGERRELRPLDVAYVEPLQPHQLRNEGSEPFGFLCLVDHRRDRPRPA